MDKSELPDLHQGDLDPAALSALFADLEACTQILEVQVKGGAERRAGGSPSLVLAQEQLLSGAVRGLQVRYLYQGEEWWDTLIRRGAAVRLVRMRAPKFRDAPDSGVRQDTTAKL